MNFKSLRDWSQVLTMLTAIVVCIHFMPSCRTKKDLFKFKKVRETIELSDTTLRRYEAIDLEWFRLNEYLIKRDGTLEIRFDSLTSVVVLPDNTIQAVGYNPKIFSSKSESNLLTAKDSGKLTKADSLFGTGSKKKLESDSEENSNTKIDRRQSITPYIGVGLAIAIVVLAVLWYFFKRK